MGDALHSLRRHLAEQDLRVATLEQDLARVRLRDARATVVRHIQDDIDQHAAQIQSLQELSRGDWRAYGRARERRRQRTWEEERQQEELREEMERQQCQRGSPPRVPVDNHPQLASVDLNNVRTAMATFADQCHEMTMSHCRDLRRFTAGSRHIPRPAASSTSARLMRCAAVENIVAQALVGHIFVDVYLTPSHPHEQPLHRGDGNGNYDYNCNYNYAYDYEQREPPARVLHEAIARTLDYLERTDDCPALWRGARGLHGGTTSSTIRRGDVVRGQLLWAADEDARRQGWFAPGAGAGAGGGGAGSNLSFYDAVVEAAVQEVLGRLGPWCFGGGGGRGGGGPSPSAAAAAAAAYSYNYRYLPPQAPEPVRAAALFADALRRLFAAGVRLWLPLQRMRGRRLHAELPGSAGNNGASAGAWNFREDAYVADYGPREEEEEEGGPSSAAAAMRYRRQPSTMSQPVIVPLFPQIVQYRTEAGGSGRERRELVFHGAALWSSQRAFVRARHEEAMEEEEMMDDEEDEEEEDYDSDWVPWRRRRNTRYR